MQIFKLSEIGAFHTNHNEDAYTLTPISQHRTLMAVMDGCSMGTESHFASTLIAKVLRQIATSLSYQSFILQKEVALEIVLAEVLRQLFATLQQLKSQLFLEKEELLSTLILGIYDDLTQDAELITIGDGLICCDGQLYEYEQDNQPDYLGYHLYEDFDHWYSQQQQRLSLQNVEDLSIATDGIFTFKAFDHLDYETIDEQQIIDYLLMNQDFVNQENMLHKKITILENTFGLKASDDLTILRIICKPQLLTNTLN